MTDTPLKPAAPKRRYKWLGLGLPLLLMVGAGIWLMADFDKAEAPTEIATAPKTLHYTLFERPEALTWLERADKKLAVGKIDTALEYYDRALAVGVESINTQIAQKFWAAENDIPFKPDRVETIAEAMSNKSRAALLLMMGKSYLNGSPAHIAVDTQKGVSLLEQAVEFGDMDAQILLDNYKTGRDISLLSDSQIVENIADIGATKVDENGDAIKTNPDDKTDSGGL